MYIRCEGRKLVCVKNEQGGLDPGQRYILDYGNPRDEGIRPSDDVTYKTYRALQRHVRNEASLGVERAYGPHLHTSYTGKHCHHRIINSRIP